MPKRRKTWVYAPPRKNLSPVPEAFKKEVETKANELIESTLKPAHVKPHREDEQFNYIADIYAKWHGSSFYFCATYHCAGPNAISPSFESKFARLEYVGNCRFNLSYMRHTEKWFELFAGLSLEECLAAIRDQPYFVP